MLLDQHDLGGPPTSLNAPLVAAAMRPHATQGAVQALGPGTFRVGLTMGLTVLTMKNEAISIPHLVS